MYQALYRKYRPRRFSCEKGQIGVVGQEHITETLRRQLISNRLSHAYLFVGTRGTGKTTCAKILARAANCLNSEDGEPCNKCISCIGIADGSILDVLELDAASHNGVDDVRALRDEAIYTPASVKKRVYIIDEVHMLSTPAFNALLKILEEPPEHILFILATTELHKVPATIMSRCQSFSFKRLPPPIIAQRLKEISDKEDLTLTEEAAEKLSVLADGSMRNGISLLDQCASKKEVDLPHVRNTLGLAGHQELLGLISAIAESDVTKALGVIDVLYDDGKDMAALLSDIAMIVRDTLVFKLDSESALLSNSFEPKDLSGLSGTIESERLFFCLDVIKDSMLNLSRSGITKLAVEMCIIKICDDRLSEDRNALLSRIAQLETGARATNTDVNKSYEAEESAKKSESTKPVKSKTEDESALKEDLAGNIREDIADGKDVTEEAADTKDEIQDTPQNAIQQEIFPWTQHLNISAQDEEKLNEKRSKLDSLSAFAGVEFKD